MLPSILPLRAFQGDPALKAKYQARLTAPRNEQSVFQQLGLEAPQFPDALGLPEWLAHMADAVYKFLPDVQAVQLVADFFATIPVGANVEPARHRLAIARMDLLLESLKDNAEAYAEATRKVLEQVKALHALALTDNPPDDGAWNAAESAAKQSASESEWRAWTVTDAESKHTAWSTERAALSAAASVTSVMKSASWCAKWSAWPRARIAASNFSDPDLFKAAWNIAWKAAWSAHYEWEATALLALLRAV